MLSGDNGILQKATEAKTKTERQSIVEQARTDVLGYQAENKGGDLEKSQLKSVLDTYFKDVPAVEELPDSLDLLNREFTTLDKYGTHQIKVFEIYNGNIQSNSVELKVGDYIKYGDKLTATTYTTDTNETGYTTTQTFTTNKNMLWRVLSIKNNKIELVATQSILSSDNLSGLYLQDKNGFLNAEKILKDLCERLYNSDYGTARSINVEDINELTQYTPEDVQTYTYSSGGPYWDKTTNTFKEENSSVVIANDYYSYAINNNIPLYETLVTEVPYWLSSRCTRADGFNMDCDVRTVNNGEVSWRRIYYNNMMGYSSVENGMYAVRPIVTLNASTSITKGIGTEQNPFEL